LELGTGTEGQKTSDGATEPRKMFDDNFSLLDNVMDGPTPGDSKDCAYA